MLHYLTGHFAWDLMIVLPFFLEKFGVHYTNFLMLMRLTRVKKMLTKIEQISNFEVALCFQIIE